MCGKSGLHELNGIYKVQVCAGAPKIQSVVCTRNIVKTKLDMSFHRRLNDGKHCRTPSSLGDRQAPA